ncbi:HAUS1-like protein [Mya arenaria]|uniref:HAUS1-like protein n=1 Tax=Mya arenaria TaxID=6604 RepID=A0ABY7DTE1_MYAAR|nr:HAUS1-like protein [Mya arenaria]
MFGDQSVPAYELNKFTVDTLAEIMRRNKRAEKHNQLLIHDHRQKADEYTAESVRLGGILESIGMTSTSLSQSGLMSLRTLANLALTLNTVDASETSFLLALGQLEEELCRVDEARRALQKSILSLTRNIHIGRLKHADLTKALGELERRSVEDHGEMERHARETQFIRNKAKEYRSHTHKMEGMLERTGVEPEVYHQALTERAQALERLKQEIVPLKKKLDSYHGLVPGDLEEELRGKIDLMQRFYSLI